MLGIREREKKKIDRRYADDGLFSSINDRSVLADNKRLSER